MRGHWRAELTNRPVVLGLWARRERACGQAIGGCRWALGAAGKPHSTTISLGPRLLPNCFSPLLLDSGALGRWPSGCPQWPAWSKHLRSLCPTSFPDDLRSGLTVAVPWPLTFSVRVDELPLFCSPLSLLPSCLPLGQLPIPLAVSQPPSLAPWTVCISRCPPRPRLSPSSDPSSSRRARGQLLSAVWRDVVERVQGTA